MKRKRDREEEEDDRGRIGYGDVPGKKDEGLTANGTGTLCGPSSGAEVVFHHSSSWRFEGYDVKLRHIDDIAARYVSATRSSATGNSGGDTDCAQTCEGWDALPWEIDRLILSHLGAKDLARLLMACRFFVRRISLFHPEHLSNAVWYLQFFGPFDDDGDGELERRFRPVCHNGRGGGWIDVDAPRPTQPRREEAGCATA